MPEVLHVAVGVIIDLANKVLITKRSPNVHQGGLWEFPGGKLEAGETVLHALQRELHEELDIVIDPDRCFPLKKICHQYEDRTVLLDIWRVDRFSGSPQGRESQPLAWCDVEALDPMKFPQANREIIEILQLPQVLAISSACESLSEFRRKLITIIDQDIKLIQFRQPSLAAAAYLHWAKDAWQLCQKKKVRLLLNCSVETFALQSADGLHVNATRLMELEERPLGKELMFSASCHNESELKHAEHINVDFALLSPVKPSASHPVSESLGWSRFHDLASRVSVPVYAMGGLEKSDLPRSLLAGAHGIAGIRAFWGSAE